MPELNNILTICRAWRHKGKEMKKLRNTIRYSLLLLLLTVFIISGSNCKIFSPPESQEPVTLGKGASSFLNELSQMSGPLGILPDIPEFNAYPLYPSTGDIFRMTTANYFEFFVFDSRRVIVILSLNPVYYIIINSKDFYWHVFQEYEQIKAGVTGTSKRKLSDNWFHSVGQYSEVGIAFNPEELYYLTSGTNRYRIRDLWKLYDAAANVVSFEPTLIEEQMFSDFNAHIAAGKTRLIYANTCSLLPTSYTLLPAGDVKFGFIVGRNLALTDAILDNNNINFVNQQALTRDFAIFFSQPIGNSKNSSFNYLSKRDGVVVILRGNVSKIISHLENEGIPFSRGSGAVNVALTDNEGGNKLDINWGTNISSANVKISRSTDGVSFTTVLDTNTSGTNYAYNAPARGYMYRVVVTDTGSGVSSDPKDIILGKDPSAGELILTEVLWMGSSNSTTSYTADEFMEFKNTSAFYIRVDNVSLEVSGTSQITPAMFQSVTASYRNLKSGEYFIVVNYKDQLFNESGTGYNLTVAGVKHLVNIDVNLSNTLGYTIRIMLGAVQIDTMTVSTGNNGALDERSAVRLSNDTWSTSAIDVGVGDFAGHTFCSPGYQGAGER